MRSRMIALFAAAALLLVPLGARADDTIWTNDGVTVQLRGDGIFLSTPGFGRGWRAGTMQTQTVGSSNAIWSDFRLQLGGVVVPSGVLTVDDVHAEPIEGGARITWRLSLPGTLRVTRIVEAWGDVSGMRARTILDPLVPLTLGAYTLDEINSDRRSGVSSIHAFRAGADWRYDNGWDPQGLGDDRRGHWRATSTKPAGEDNAANGQWLSVDFEPQGAFTYAMVMERRNAASSVMSFAGDVMAAGVDLSRDIVYTGPFEESIHVENPADPIPTADAFGMASAPQPGARARSLVPGRSLALEPVVTIGAPTADLAAWEFHQYLTNHRAPSYPRAVTFNTNGVDTNAISTGAKDDVDHARVVALAQAAREMGVETFILDDGWQARSGDWCPDSPQCPEPRWDGQDQRFQPRFLDDEFRAVREVLAGDPHDPSDDMALGLWMTPMEFHPSAAAFERNPQWSCAPVGTGTALPSYADGGGSFDAGIGVWNPAALGRHPDTGELVTLARYIEDRIRRAIDVYGATYFKFDFLVWLDCMGAEPTDMYDYHDAFVGMLDRLIATYPDVTFSIDETNDYRLFPFESVARGPSWFQNGKPPMRQLLHNQWNLAPYVPGYSLGQHAASNNGEVATHGIDKVMAVTLGEHITFWNEIDDDFTSAQRSQIRRWTDFYKQHRDTLATFTFPLLADPLENGWTALQPWDVDAQRGWVLAYRQSSGSSTATIGMRGIADAGTYTVHRHDPATGSVTSLGTVTAAQLRSGLDVTIGATNAYALLQIERI